MQSAAMSFSEDPLSLLGQYSDDEAEEEEPETTHSDMNTDKSTSQTHHTGHVDTQVANFMADLEVSGLLEDENLVAGGAPLGSELVGMADTENHGEANAVCGPQGCEIERYSDILGSQIANKGLTSHAISHQQTPETAGGKMEVQEKELEWEAVLHEESGEYYYWNTRTGETTWETPLALKQKDECILVTDKDIFKGPEEDTSTIALRRDPERPLKDEALSENNSKDFAGVSKCDVQLDSLKKLESDVALEQTEYMMASTENLNFDENLSDPTAEDSLKAVIESDNFTVETTAVSEGHNIENLAESSMLQHSILASKSEPNSTTLPSAFSEASPERAGSASAENENSPCSQSCFDSDEPNLSADSQPKDKAGWFLQWADRLSSRLKYLTKGDLSLPLCLRLAVEVEVRLNDCKALASQGCLEGAFLVHAEAQFKRIESVLALEEAVMSMKLEQQRLLVTAAESPKNCLFTADKSQCSRQLHDSTENELSLLPAKASDTGTGAKNEEIRKSDDAQVQVAERLTSSITGNVDLGHVGDTDVDMEVDMDVDDAVETHPEPFSVSSKQGLLPMDGVSQAGLVYRMTPEANHSSFASVDYPPIPSSPLPPGTSISDMWPPPPPPPPDDEWAPPPPEHELTPPPPPEEPPPLPPLSPHDVGPVVLAQSIPSLALYEGVAMGYTSIPHPYYYYEPFHVQSTHDMTHETFSKSLYSEGPMQVEKPMLNWPDPHQSLDISPSIQPDLGAADMNSVSAVVDYVPPLPLPVSAIPVVSSSMAPFMPFQAAPSVAFNVESTVDVTAVPFITVSATSNLESDVTKLVRPSTASVVAVSTTSTMVAPDAALGVAPAELMPTTNIKKPAKATRPKKRTHTVAVSAPLISNKKVSTLVHKWMAAKEELHGNVEDEDDKALYDIEALEKKRQKEIEDWRRDQLASGEALENANFQPLGTLDWRERVKRAKKVEAVELENSIPQGSTKSTEMHVMEGMVKKKPDLEELSRELPSGWQAFWDENSGDVYYGNLDTSETTWERPLPYGT
ncbi:hypothetical protein O6H91_15G071400 [Diphasiastrum complanatum]|uniref:Uncharacterized protein n=2 Tax=Diphasiastrum complanatum TaxID=34168 RepID=A0ACC2BJJ5_DIPCM|nr:hypothetical protein O6H91_15G071400 [Diphasiastrum complanatum]